jgi:hypothetical protein
VHDDEALEFVGSDVVTRNTRVISQNLIEILTDTNSRQWDDGWVLLADGYQFRLWSNTNLEPIERDGESIDEFTACQRAARRDRITLLANRAERTLAAQQAHEADLPPVLPPVLPPRRLSANASADAIRVEKQVLLNRLANRVAENTTDPLDKLMFDYLNRIEAESARAAFQKVLDSGQDGLDACTEGEKQIMANWKSKSESKTQKRAEEAARQLGVYSNLYPTDTP